MNKTKSFRSFEALKRRIGDFEDLLIEQYELGVVEKWITGEKKQNNILSCRSKIKRMLIKDLQKMLPRGSKEPHKQNYDLYLAFFARSGKRTFVEYGFERKNLTWSSLIKFENQLWEIGELYSADSSGIQYKYIDDFKSEAGNYKCVIIFNLDKNKYGSKRR